MHADPSLDLRRSGHMQCTPVPSLAESARSDAAILCTFDFFESACCATAVDVSRPSGGSCGGAACSVLCEDHTSSQTGSSTRSAAFVLADDASRERRDGSVALLTSPMGEGKTATVTVGRRQWRKARASRASRFSAAAGRVLGTIQKYGTTPRSLHRIN